MKLSLELTHKRPYPLQWDILRHPAKRKVICAGRRAGKTVLAAIVAVRQMMKYKRVLLASPTQKQADVFWRYTKRWCAPLISARAITKNETNRTLELVGRRGGAITVKTASDPDVLRGDYADFVVLDECALLRPEAWYEVVMPMLLDHDGSCWFISTPRRKNWFFTLYNKGLSDEQAGKTRWHSWQFTSFANPHLKKVALDESIEDMTEDAYNQEIMAQFLDGEGAVFRRISQALYDTYLRDGSLALGSPPESHRGHYCVMGVDWARKNDFTSLSVFCVTCQKEVAIDRFNKIEWEFQRGRLKALGELFAVKYYLAESNSIGEPNIEALQNEGLPIYPFEMTAQSKPQVVRALALALERQKVGLLNAPVATGELEAYEGIESKATGHMRYSAPEGMHDDTVVSRMLGYRAMVEGAPGIDAEALAALIGAGR